MRWMILLLFISSCSVFPEIENINRSVTYYASCSKPVYVSYLDSDYIYHDLDYISTPWSVTLPFNKGDDVYLIGFGASGYGILLKIYIDGVLWKSAYSTNVTNIGGVIP